MGIGRATPLPEEVAFLHLGDMCELPCWIGIMPGKTTTDEAKKILSKVYFQGKPLSVVADGNGSYSVDISSGFTVGIEAYPRNDSRYPVSTVASIALYQLESLKIPVGYVTDSLIRPEYVLQYGTGWDTHVVRNLWADVYFLRGDLYVTNVGDYEIQMIQGIAMSQTIYQIRLAEKKDSLIYFEYDSKWHGFGFYPAINIPYGLGE